MTKTARILIAVQEQVERVGIQTLLSDVVGLTVVAETDNSSDAIRLCREIKPDIILTTLHVAGSNPVDFVTHLRQHCSQTKILLWSSRCEPACLHELVVAGISGYLLKDTLADALLSTIHAIINDVNCFSSRITQEFVKQVKNQLTSIEIMGLTRREQQILGLMAKGKNNITIATELNLAPQTIRNYSSLMYAKLGVSSRSEAVLWERENSLRKK